MTIARTARFLLTILLLALPLAAQDLVNGTFDTDLEGWAHDSCVPGEPNECLRSWTSFDRTVSADSGSARLFKDYLSANLLPLDQCLPAGPDQAWTMVGWALPTAGNPPFAAGLQFSYWADATCSDFQIDLGFSRSDLVTAPGFWSEVKLFATTPPLTQSVEVRLFLYETSAVIPVSAHFDDLKVGIFLASFEDGLLDDWSFDVP